MRYFKNESIEPEEINPVLEQLGSSPVRQKMKMFSILSRPNLSIIDFTLYSEKNQAFLKGFRWESVLQAEILMKYEGYLNKESEMVEKVQRLEELVLPDDFDYKQMTSLSSESREKLAKIRPRTIGQASRISGVSPADISILMVYLGR